jgi:ribosome-associated protein
MNEKRFLMSVDVPLLKWRDLLVKALDDKQAHNIRWLDVQQIFPLADYFIVASAYSHRHLWALCQAVEDTCKSVGFHPLVQGKHQDSQWIVVDARGIFVHLFLQEGRDYYQLERMWGIPQEAPSSPENVHLDTQDSL